MSARPVATGRLRRRLAITFALAVGIATGALAIGSYLVVRSARLDDSQSRAVSQSRFNLRFATGEPSPQALVAAYATRGDFCTIVLPADGDAIRSNLTCPGPRQIPGELLRLVGEGRLASQRLTVAGRHQVAVGGRVAGRDERIVFFFDEQQVWDDLDALRNVLAAGWLLLTLLGAVAGTLLARRVLAPVAQASAAARSLAEGLLDTRLPVTGDDEFADWAASFNEMADALAAKIEALSQAQDRERRFTANVAHELRTPLTALMGEAELLAGQSGPMPEEARKLAAMLVADVERLRRLTDDLLEISRIDSGSEQTQTELLDAVALVRALLQARGWDGQVAIDAEPALLQSDRRRVERIVANLVENAVVHGGRGVRVSVRPRPGAVVIEVADAGSGIDAAFLPHVFDRFSKGDRSRSGAGSGLGLAIAAENARLLGGEIEARNDAGGGAVFTVTLPVAERLPAGDGPVAGEGDAGDVPQEA